MPPRISLALAIHNHQPVGNFGWVIRDVYERAYEPLVGALERHPDVRLALHYTGPLLEWIRAEQPELVARIRALVGRGQVEIVGGGWFEPILASLPDRDRLVQLERMAYELETSFGGRPRGAWVAERVWEPDLPRSIVAAGYEWTILDDQHFRAAAVAEDALWGGAFTTEDQGRLLRVFGTEQGLRYRIPFGEVDDVIAYLRAHATDAGDRLGTMGDDGEKFGGWPTTWEHCWGERRWVDRFFSALEANREWLATVTPSEWLAGHDPVGRIYVPTSSYAEMGEWSLPAAEAAAFTAVLERDRAEGRPEARWLRGGFWRSFQVKYREVNDLHKQMLRASAAVAAMPPGPDRDRATDDLGRGQSNDCYWHGLFGGIYIAHMRLATLAHLIAAEDVADRVIGGARSGLLVDLDLDGRAEVLLRTEGEVVVVKPDEGAGIGEWDVRAARHALLAVMRRRPEAYHAALVDAERARDARGGEGTRVGAAGGSSEDGAPASIHELVRAKEPGLAGHLQYDAYERRSGLVHVLGPDVDPASFASGTFDERLDAVDGPFDVVDVTSSRVVVARDAAVRLDDGSTGAVRIERSLSIGGPRPAPFLDTETTVTNVGEIAVHGRLGIEWSTMLLGGGHNPDAWWECDGARSAHDEARVERGVRRLAQGNDWLGVRVDTQVTPAADAWISPIETVSNSESGFERVYQGSCLLLSVPLALPPAGVAVVRIRHDVTVSEAAADPAANTEVRG